MDVKRGIDMAVEEVIKEFKEIEQTDEGSERDFSSREDLCQ